MRRKRLVYTAAVEVEFGQIVIRIGAGNVVTVCHEDVYVHVCTNCPQYAFIATSGSLRSRLPE